jgi:hypothetical protein
MVSRAKRAWNVLSVYCIFYEISASASSFKIELHFLTPAKVLEQINMNPSTTNWVPFGTNHVASLKVQRRAVQPNWSVVIQLSGRQAVHCCTLSCNITWTVHWNGTRFIFGFILICLKNKVLFNKMKLILISCKKCKVQKSLSFIMWPSWDMQILSEAFHNAVDNTGVIPCDNV